MTRLTQWPAQEGLEGVPPSKNPIFLVVFAGKAGKYHQKKKIVGREDVRRWITPRTRAIIPVQYVIEQARHWVEQTTSAAHILRQMHLPPSMARSVSAGLQL